MGRHRLLSSDTMEAVDRISNLAEPIIHHIMSYLSRRDAARISTLSKRFKLAWYSFPIIDYDISDWKFHSQRTTSQAEKLEKFINNVYDSIQFRSCEISWHKLRLHAGWVVANKSEHMAIVRDLVVSALQKDVKSVDVCFDSLHFSVPDQLFSARSVTVLKLDGCLIDQSDLLIDRNFSVVDLSITRCRGIQTMKGCCDRLMMLTIVHCTGLNQIDISSKKLHKVEIVECTGLREIDIKASGLESFAFFESKDPRQPCVVKIESCTAMKRLTMSEAQVTNEWMDHVEKFATLEVLELLCCYTPRDLYLKHDSVFKVNISYCYGLENIISLASNLEYFEYYPRPGQLPCKFNLGNSQYLKSLILYSACVTDRWLEFELPLFRYLKHLELFACAEMRKPKICNSNLETLKLYNCPRLEEAEIRAPNLSSLVYSGGLTSTLILVSCPDVEIFLNVSQWIMKTDVQIYVWWEHLRLFLLNLNHSNKLTLVCPAVNSLVFPKEFRETSISPLHDLRCLAVKITESSSEDFEGLLDSLLWLAPRLNTVSIKLGTKERTLKFQYDKKVTLGLKDEHCYCRRWPFRCWRHYLTEVTMENFDDGFVKRSLHTYFWKQSMRMNAIHST